MNSTSFSSGYPATSLELQQVADYFCRARNSIPPRCNLDKDISAIGLPVRKIDDNKYQVVLYKVEPDKKFNTSYFRGVLQPALNQALDKVRTIAEQRVLSEQFYVKNCLLKLNEKYNNPFSAFCGNDCHFQARVQEVQQSYQLSVQQMYYLLLGLNVITYMDCDNCVILTLECDASYRIDL